MNEAYCLRDKCRRRARAARIGGITAGGNLYDDCVCWWHAWLERWFG